MARVEGGDKVDPALEHRPDEQLDPFRRDAAEVAVDHGARLGPHELGHAEDRAQGASLARDAEVAGPDAVQGPALVIDDQRGVVAGLRLEGDVRRAVARHTVRVHQDAGDVRVVLGEPRADGADHVAHCARVVEAGDPHEDIGPADALQLASELGAEEAVARHPSSGGIEGTTVRT